MFEQANRMKLRFATPVGDVTTEDLWDLPLTGKRASLDGVAKIINRTIKDTEEESFVVAATTSNKENELKFDIVKHVIKVKLEENEKARNAVANKAKKEKILSVIASKEDSAMQDMDLDKLKAMVEEL